MLATRARVDVAAHPGVHGGGRGQGRPPFGAAEPESKHARSVVDRAGWWWLSGRGPVRPPASVRTFLPAANVSLHDHQWPA